MPPIAPNRWRSSASPTSCRRKPWLDVLTQAAELGLLQLHLSGGERTVRRDLEDIVGLAAKVGLWHGADPSYRRRPERLRGTMPDTVRPSTRCRSFS
jgi:hypothetical protein